MARATIKKTYLSGALIYPLTIADAVYDVSDENNPQPISLTLKSIKNTVFSGTINPITNEDIDTIYNTIKG